MENPVTNTRPEIGQTTYKTLTEIELSYLVFKFDSRALEELYNRYSSLLYSLISQITLKDDVSEDILADVFSIVWQHIDKFDFSTGNFYTWVTTITRNSSVDYLRRNRDSEFSDKPYNGNYENLYIIPFLSPKTDPLDINTALNLKERIDDAISDLSDVQKYIIHLVYYEGYTISGISKKLNITENKVIEKIRSAFDSFAEYFFFGSPHANKEPFAEKTGIHNPFHENLESKVFTYSIGCLNPEYYSEISEEINSLPGESKKILGLFQVINSLLPVIIDLKSPGPNTKNKTAKKLYDVSKQGKLKRNKNLSDLPPVEEILKEKNLYEKYFTNYQAKAPADFESKEAKEFVHQGEVHQEEIPFENKPVLVERPINDYEAIQKEKLALLRKAVKKDFRKIIFLDLILVIIISVVISGGVYYFLNGQIKNDQVHILRLNDKIGNLNEEISRLNVEQKIFYLQNAKNTKSYPLDGTGSNTGGFGKLILSMTNKEGLLQVYNMPVLPDNKVYQLWLISKGQPFSLGTFKVSRNSENLYLSELPDIEEKNIDSIQLTVENENGASFPSGEVYLSRSIK